MKDVSISISGEIVQPLRIRAATEGARSITAYLEKILREHLDLPPKSDQSPAKQ